MKMVNSPGYREAVEAKMGHTVDVSSLEHEREQYRAQLRQVVGAKNKLTAMLDKLDVEDKHYDRKYQDMQDRLDNLYDKISELEDAIADIDEKINGAYGEQVTTQYLYSILKNFEELYYEMTDLEKKEFMRDFIESIEVLPERTESGRILKRIDLRFPIYYEGNEGKEIRLLNETSVETVVKLSLKKDTPKIEITMEPDDESNYTSQEKATYQKIKDYVKNMYGVNVHTSYIAQVKRMCGLDMGENYNKSKKENPEVKQCPQEKVEYIKDALRYFRLI